MCHRINLLAGEISSKVPLSPRDPDQRAEEWGNLKFARTLNRWQILIQKKIKVIENQDLTIYQIFRHILLTVFQPLELWLMHTIFVMCTVVCWNSPLIAFGLRKLTSLSYLLQPGTSKLQLNISFLEHVWINWVLDHCFFNSLQNRVRLNSNVTRKL